MKYRNAQDILPDRLLRELQQYVSGETLYIPSNQEKKFWGRAPAPENIIKGETRKFAKNTAAEPAWRNWPGNTISLWTLSGKFCSGQSRNKALKSMKAYSSKPYILSYCANCLPRHSGKLFPDIGSLAQSGVQYLLAYPQIGGCDLQQLVGVDKVQGLLQAHDLGGVSRSALSALEERVLVSCFFLQTLISISSLLPVCPTTMPLYTFSPGPINRIPRSWALYRP